MPPSRFSVLSDRAGPLKSPAAVGLPAALPAPTSPSTSARATLCFKKVGVFTGTAQNPFRTQGDRKPLESGVVLPRKSGSLSAGSAATVGSGRFTFTSQSSSYDCHSTKAIQTTFKQMPVATFP